MSLFTSTSSVAREHIWPFEFGAPLEPAGENKA